jgi:branched-subunit amino acid transport protein
MSAGRLALVIGVLAAGVLLPKAAPAALLSAPLSQPVERFLGLLPAVLLGGLVVVSAAGTSGARSAGSLRPAVLLAVAVAVGVAALTRRSLLAMACGWAALAFGLALS